MSQGRASHPPTLLTLVGRELRELGVPRRGELVLAGVSGGPDSQALVHVLARLRRTFHFELEACGIDHGLRAEAAGELRGAALLAASLGVPFRGIDIRVAAGANLMARAREARYAALRDAARASKASWIAVGHHADDRAETVLMRLMRGTGPAGLAVFGPRSGNLLRPMIRARRSDVLRHLGRHGIAFSTDPTNEDRRHLRAVVRHELLPALERHAPRIIEHLCALADDMGAMGLEPPPRGLARAHIRALASATDGRGSARVALPGGRVACLDLASGQFVVEPSNRSRLSQEGDLDNPDAR